MAFKSFKDISNKKSSTTETTKNTVATTKLPFINVRVDREIGKAFPVVVKFLHSLDKSVDLSIHKLFDPANGSRMLLCEEHWKDKCQYCSENSYAKSVKCLVSYAVSLIDKKWQIGDKSGPYQLVRVAMIPLGRNSVNIEPLHVASKEKILTERMWLFTKSKQRIKDKDMYVNNPPKIIYPEDYSSVVGSTLPSLDKLPDTALKFTKMSEEDIFTAIINSFDNGEDLLKSINPTEEESHSLTEDYDSDPFEGF